MIALYPIMAFSQTTRAEESLAFYRDIIGLRLIEDSPFALVFQGSNAVLRVQKIASFTPQPFTVLGWEVTDIQASAVTLKKLGVVFERYDGMKQDENGIWTSPNGAHVCWFKDPDGNLLSLSHSA